jgi:hypothetical protein
MDVSKDILTILTQLMPGFLTAWVVYGLTTYTKPSQFERIVQALIYSFIVSALVAVLETLLLFAGRCICLGTWDHSAEVIASASIAITLGFLLSFFMTDDAFFSLARRIGVTSRTAFPSEWYGAFKVGPPRYVVLHLDNGRRITGYPSEWPTEPTIGHFKLIDAAWLDDDNKDISLDMNHSILIAAKQVEMVEFLKSIKERTNATEET